MIAIECACGKRAKVQDELAGRKIKCPECKEPLVVPGERAPKADGLPRKERTPAAGVPRRTPAGGVPRARADDDEHAPKRKGALAGLPRRGAKEEDDGAERPCPYCAEPIKKVARKCRHCGESLVEEGAGDARRRDVDHERHVRAIAVWFRIAGLLMGLLSLAMGLLGVAGGARMAGLGLVISGVLFAFAAGYYAIGHFLFQYASGARIAALVLCALGIGLNLLQMVGNKFQLPTVMGGGIQIAYTCAILWALGGGQGARICSAEYQALVRRTPDVKVPFWTSPFFFIPAGLLVLVLLLGLFAATR